MGVLTRDEEVALVERSRNGDKGAEDELIVANLPLVKHLSARYRDCGVEREDLVQEGTFGLIDAVRSFDLGRRTALSTYAGMLIVQRMLRTIEKQRRRADRESPLYSTDVVAAAVPDRVESDDALSIVAVTIGELTLAEREVMRLRLQGRTFVGIAEETGRSRVGVRRIKKRAIAKLRSRLNPTAA